MNYSHRIHVICLGNVEVQGVTEKEELTKGGRRDQETMGRSVMFSPFRVRSQKVLSRVDQIINRSSNI